MQLIANQMLTYVQRSVVAVAANKRLRPIVVTAYYKSLKFY